MAKFNMENPFISEDWDVADIVMMTDERLDEAEEKAEEKADDQETDDIGVIDALKESGVVGYDDDDEDEIMEYDETLDDEADLVGGDAADYRIAKDDTTEAEDLEEDDEIDIIIDELDD